MLGWEGATHGPGGADICCCIASASPLSKQLLLRVADVSDRSGLVYFWDLFCAYSAPYPRESSVCVLGSTAVSATFCLITNLALNIRRPGT